MLLPVPDNSGGYRQYPVALIDRIRFIKRAQELGFLLAEIASLLALQDGADRAAIRSITSARLAQIELKLRDLKHMGGVLCDLLRQCEHTQANIPCPIIESITSPRP